MRAWLPPLALVTAACATSVADEAASPPARSRPPAADAPKTGREVQARRGHAYVNTGDALFEIDPDTLALTRLGAFDFAPGAADAITDIAIDRDGRLYGVGFEALYRIDRATLHCAPIARYPGRSFNTLAVLPAAVKAHYEGPDLLVAAEAHSSTVSGLDPQTGADTVLGDLGDGQVAGGDLAWVPGRGPVMITIDSAGREGLARIERDTFAARPLPGPWGFALVRGLVVLPAGLVGVSEGGDLLDIDAATGSARQRTHVPLVLFGGATDW
ncbi:MAG: hypothetical protein K8W52_18570 [Deltaproteobacteria bacterium]|nr:hypothetical protein [Deltaproteobacteria bacterium]